MDQQSKLPFGVRRPDFGLNCKRWHDPRSQTFVEKKEVRVFDYVDRAVPMLRRMFEKRLRGYRAIGYTESEVPEEFELMSEQWPADWEAIEDEE